eukprot:10271700-Lingulodinium_polyedra.AAC.1
MVHSAMVSLKQNTLFLKRPIDAMMGAFVRQASARKISYDAGGSSMSDPCVRSPNNVGACFYSGRRASS